ncbi:Rossmann-like and DUF2520 domain-containing protein [Williamsia sterculiae]|uniref:Predicted oxidoreductase, contains short-chain dehydrogenase (SDR) and DUF2520 domains n=1 Tax=Williamsia sterculiae TaxID=1344003 RepID=A0A1N7CRL4_9NOCA|nr:DUF2520 domain-containing protein [Williamsia sterculiae]SIR66223.1 Predicted oxidoreductase, contains short-chain dehydrogenase (SDR) and DUF2520 domains [Williamsia sterculiae]
MTGSGYTELPNAAGNWPAPARLTVGIVSAGRVGTAIGAALEQVDHVVGSVAARSPASLRRADERLPDSEVLTPDRVAARSELLILAVPDAVLVGVIDDLVGAVRPGTIVAHTAGAHGVGVLAPLAARGATPLAIHPAMTFTGGREDTTRLRTACFGVTAADEIGYAVASALVLEMGGEPVRIREEARPLYHAALAHGANHLVALVSDAVAALRAAIAGQELPGQEPVDDRPGGLAERMLAPLLTAALQNTLESGSAALTGPVARGDTAAVAAHLRALAEVDPDLTRGYRAMSLRAAHHTPDPPADLIALLEEDAP